LLIDAFGRIEEDMLRCLEGLSPDQLAFQPGEASNSIGWLAWHLTRVQDDHMSDLAGHSQAWIEDAWHARFDKPADPHDTGFGYSADQVAAFRPSGASVLRDYFLAVHQRSLRFLSTVTAADLDRELDEPQWETPVTVGVRLVSVINDCTAHVGQMAYVRGLIENRHWLGF
jgi:uncharacterized damage-inducible protein DinB